MDTGIDSKLHPAEQAAMLAGVAASRSSVGECEASLRTITGVRAYLDVVESQFTRRLRRMRTVGKASANSVAAFLDPGLTQPCPSR